MHKKLSLRAKTEPVTVGAHATVCGIDRAQFDSALSRTLHSACQDSDDVFVYKLF